MYDRFLSGCFCTVSSVAALYAYPIHAYLLCFECCVGVAYLAASVRNNPLSVKPSNEDACASGTQRAGDSDIDIALAADVP